MNGLEKCKVFYSEIPGSFFNTRRKHLALSDKTNCFAIDLLEENEVNAHEKNIRWVEFPLEEGTVYATVSSLAQTLLMPEETIIDLARNDPNNANLLTQKIQTHVETYLSIREFISDVLNGKLNNKLTNEEIDTIIDQHIGVINENVESLYNKFIQNNRNYALNIDQHLIEFASACINENIYENVLTIAFDYICNRNNDEKSSKFTVIYLEEALKLNIKKITKESILKTKQKLISNNIDSPENIKMHLDEFFEETNNKFDAEFIKIKDQLYQAFKEKFKLDAAIIQLFEKIKFLDNDEIKEIWSNLLMQNMKFPQEIEKHLIKTLKKLKAIASSLFLEIYSLPKKASIHLNECKVVYGNATDIGFLSGMNKKRMKLSDSKRFHVALLENDEISKSCKLPSSEGLVNADISSLSARLWIPKETIINFIELDKLNKTCQLAEIIEKHINAYQAIKVFIFDVRQGKLSNKINNDEIEELINQKFGTIDFDIKGFYEEFIGKNKSFPNEIFNHLLEFSLKVKSHFSDKYENSLAKLYEYIVPLIHNKNKKIDVPEIERNIELIFKRTRDTVYNQMKILLYNNHEFPENSVSHIEAFLKNLTILAFPTKDIGNALRQKLELNKAINEIWEKVKKTRNEEIKTFWGDLIDKNRESPQNIEKHLDELFCKLKGIDETLFTLDEVKIPFFVKKAEKAYVEKDYQLIEGDDLPNLDQKWLQY